MQHIDRIVSNKMRNTAFVCACLIVFRHAPLLDGGSLSFFVRAYWLLGVCDIAVPFFFYASGFFVAGDYLNGVSVGYWRTSLLKRLKRLGVPYLLFCTMAYVLKGMGGEWASLVRVENLISGYGLNPDCLPAYYLLWYVRTLLLFTLLAPCFVVVIRKSRVWAIGTISILLLLYFALPKSAALGVVDPKWLIFYCAGMAMRSHLPDFCGFAMRIWLPLAVIGIGCFCLEYGVGCSSLHVLALIPLVAVIYSVIPGANWPMSFVSCSFAIYLLHGLIFYALRMMISFGGLMYYMISGFGVIILCVALAALGRRYLPKCYELCMGGK